MTRAAAALALLLAACASTAPAFSPAEVVPVTEVSADASPRLLCVVAHPDDEIAFAGTLYKTATFLGGACDVFTITNGEGGFKYATFAERIHGMPLTDEAVGRAELPEIRRRELAAGCRWLGVRNIFFLREQDHRYTTDVGEVLGPGAAVWDLARVRGELDRVLAAGRYDFVLTHLPPPDTHAHHKAATILALEAAARMPEASRPVLLGTRTATDGDPPRAPYEPLPGWTATRLADAPGPYVFDRRQRCGHQGRLDYRVVVNWAIAEHKSQGTMQLLMNRGDREEHFLFAGNPPDAAARAASLFERLRAPQFAEREYGESAGTNVTPRQDTDR